MILTIECTVYNYKANTATMGAKGKALKPIQDIKDKRIKDKQELAKKEGKDNRDRKNKTWKGERTESAQNQKQLNTAGARTEGQGLQETSTERVSGTDPSTLALSYKKGKTH